MLMRRRHAVLVAAIGGSIAVPVLTAPHALGTPTAAQAVNVLYKVSCPTPDWCMAVGLRSGRIERALAEVWNGGRWRPLVTPALLQGSVGVLRDVACRSPRFCVSVGNSYRNSFQAAGLVEQWNGRTWRLRHLRLPAGALLSGVSCARRACMIVGEALSVGQPLAAQLAGLRLRMLRPRLPSGVSVGGLVSVSCVNPSRCMAVGGYDDPKLSSSVTDLAELWNGTTWRITSTPHPDADIDLQSVSCPSTATCLAAGHFGGAPAATLLRKAGRWKALKTTGRSSAGYAPQAASCNTASACVTAGFINSRRGGLAAEIWNGRALRFMVVSARSQGELMGISCPLPKRCVAVGAFAQPSKATRGGALAELWNGSSWRPLPVTGP
jgi:hypothetical protein